MPRILAAIVALAGAAGAASAQPSEAYRSFMAGPAGFIATKADKQAFEKLVTDAAAERFVALFWARRNPALTAGVNEFKADFDLRVAAADKQFGAEGLRGSLSDRGRTLIVMGRPFGISRQLADTPVQLIGHKTADERGAVEVWTYRRDQLPPSVKADEVYFVFVESRVGANDFLLNREERRNALPMKLLAEAPERLLRHPDLKEAPRLGLLAGSDAATAAELEALAAEPRPWPDGARVRAAQGVRSESLLPLWIHVRLPEAAPPAARVVGRARSAAGEDAGSFVAAATPIPVPGGRAYELSVPLGPGSWKVEVALLGASAPVAVTTVEAELEPAPAQGAWISPVVWGAEVRQESLATPGDPFNVGGWHVLPQPADVYRRADTLSYFCAVVRPEVSADGKAAVEASLAIFKGSKKLTETDPAQAPLSRVRGDVWMYGSSLPLDAFPGAGDYRIDLALREPASGVRRTASIPVTIVSE